MQDVDFPVRDLAKLPAFSKSITVHGNAMLPLYRHGDQLIVAEGMPMKIGDRIVVETEGQKPIAGTLIHRDDKQIIVKAGGISRKSMVFNVEELTSIGRIIWASQ